LLNDDLIWEFRTIYEQKLIQYLPKDVFNCDETGLFFKCTPTRTLCCADEELISGKFSKERVTHLFCVSLTGEKIDPVLIGKSKTPRGFKSLNWKKLKIKYEYNQKAWMKVEIFCRWLEDLNALMVSQNRKILLTLDNAPVHPLEVEFSNIELLFFPPKVTSKIQPLDQGIIRSFKALYKKKLNMKICFELGSNNNLKYDEVVKRIKIIDALKLILEAWNDLSSVIIVECYQKAIINAKMDPKSMFKLPIPLQDENDFIAYSQVNQNHNF
jgi:hypothetical protein